MLRISWMLCWLLGHRFIQVAASRHTGPDDQWRQCLRCGRLRRGRYARY